MKHSEQIVVIGSGLAAFTVVREFRKLNPNQAIVIITKESGDFYSKPMISTAFASHKEAAQLVTTPKEKMASQLHIEILGHTEVVSIDPKANEIEIKDQNGMITKLPYAKLVLATGAQQIQLPIKGNGTSQILSVNNLSEYQHFRDRIQNQKRIAIIGGGLIGCEFANDLSIGGFSVSVIDLASQLLGRLVPETIASQLQSRLSNIGVQFFLNSSVTEINQSTDGLELKLANGQPLNADVVLSAVGLRPDLTLANQSGIRTNKGIVVNRQLQTNFENIYALGDCAEINGLVLPYVLPIMAAAKVVAAGLNNQVQELIYPAMPVVVKTPALPLVVSPASANSDGAWHFIEDRDGIEARFEDDGKLLGFALAGQATNLRSTLTKLLPNILN